MESISVLKNLKISKTVQPCFGNLPYGSSQSRDYSEGFRDSLVGHCPSREKDLEFFQKSGFLDFSWLMLATCSQVEASVARVTRKVWRLSSRLTRRWTFQSRKTLRQIFPNFVTRVFGDLFATQSSCKNCVFCALDRKSVV